ncbi:MAG: FHA domain-containing protein [Fimbriiglobus sp.]
MRSIHLESPARREAYRDARAIVEDNCGELTLLGKITDLPEDHPALGADSPTLAGPAATQCVYTLKDDGKDFVLVLGINTIGRLSDNTIAIRDEHVSRRHCAIVVHQDGRVEVYDVASKNGTVVNGKKINGPTGLKNGDVITLCTRKLIFIVNPIHDPLAGLL